MKFKDFNTNLSVITYKKQNVTESDRYRLKPMRYH